MAWEPDNGFGTGVRDYREDSVVDPSCGDLLKEPEQQSITTSRNVVPEAPPLTLASSATIDPTMRLRAILIAKMPGGRAKGGILGAAVAARVLALREDTVRGWLKREDAIRDEAQVLGIDVEVLAASLPKVYPPPVHLVSNLHLSPTVDEQLKRWILLYLEESKEKTIHYSYAVKKAREFDPYFMPEPSNNATSDEKTAYATRARNWFSRFCNRHGIELAKVSKRKGNHTERGMVFTSEYKLRAIDLVRERVEGGRGPDGTRGKKAVARILGISTHAIRNWEGKEEELRRESSRWMSGTSTLHTCSASLAPPSVLISTMPPPMVDLPKPPSSLIESPTVLSSTEHVAPPYLSAWQSLSVAHIPPDSERYQQQREDDLQQPLEIGHQDPNIIIPPKAVQTSISVPTVSGLKGQQMV